MLYQLKKIKIKIKVNIHFLPEEEKRKREKNGQCENKDNFEMEGAINNEVK